MTDVELECSRLLLTERSWHKEEAGYSTFWPCTIPVLTEAGACASELPCRYLQYKCLVPFRLQHFVQALRLHLRGWIADEQCW